ncbi:hypothetical protein BJY52DRAFT_1187604 [Lactarius psammicola]|nr:hypothetical protein BJY52DRAFT_1187604 [Lactarius psammicola]
MSFISIEPQPRVLLESHSNSLLAQFDTQLQIITDRYLAFFQERRRIEANYIDSLRKLHQKAYTVEASFGHFIEPTTTRAAWVNIRDNLDRVARTQQAFVEILDNDVIEPLVTLKKSKHETRKRIEEGLKKSATEYADYAAITFSGLQQAYLKKYYSQQDGHSIDNLRRPQGVPNKRFGGKVSALLRGWQEPEPAKFKQLDGTVDIDPGLAVARLNNFQSMRAEYLRDGCDCLEELVFAPTVKDVLIKYMDGLTTACTEYDNLATSTRAEVKKALAGADTPDLTASCRHSLSFSIPPPIVVRSYRPGYSNLIFGIPLVDVETDEDNVPKVMRMCIEEVEKRGLNGIHYYSIGHPGLRRRFENEMSFSFNSADNIDLVATLLKIRKLHPVQRASLGALMRHLLRVASHSNNNSMTVKALASEFNYAVLRGNEVLEDGVHQLVLEDLIQNAHTLFDERPSPSPPVPPSRVAETTSTHTYASSFSSPRLPQSAEVQAKRSITRHRPGLVGGTSTSTQSSFSSLPLDSAMESRLTPLSTPLLSPLLGLPSSQTLAEGAETTTQEQVIPEVRGTNVVETLPDSTSPEVVSVAPTSVTEWRLRQSQLRPHPEPLTIPQSPPESVLSGTSEFPLSSATSLQTALPSMRQ